MTFLYSWLEMVEIMEARTAPMMDPASPILDVRKKTVTAESPDAAIWAKEMFLKKFFQRPWPLELFFLAVLSSRIPVAFVSYAGAFVETRHSPPLPPPFKVGPESVVHVYQGRALGKA